MSKAKAPGPLGQIAAGLAAVRADIEAGNFSWSVKLEDVHMNVESALVARIGEVGKKLHTARSRNDQVALDFRLYVRDTVDHLDAQLEELQLALARKAEQHAATVMPGFTHLQVAQPAGAFLDVGFQIVSRVIIFSVAPFLFSQLRFKKSNRFG